MDCSENVEVSYMTTSTCSPTPTLSCRTKLRRSFSAFDKQFRPGRWNTEVLRPGNVRTHTWVYGDTPTVTHDIEQSPPINALLPLYAPSPNLSLPHTTNVLCCRRLATTQKNKLLTTRKLGCHFCFLRIMRSVTSGAQVIVL